MMLIVTSHQVGKAFFNQTNNANQTEQNESCNCCFWSTEVQENWWLLVNSFSSVRKIQFKLFS